MNAYTPVKARAELLVDLSARYSDASGHAARLRFLWKKHAWHLLVGGASALRKFAAAKSSASKKRSRIRNRTMRRPAFTCTTRPYSARFTFSCRRGELEITDVNNMYIKEGTMTSALLEGWWTDAGMFASLLRATNLVAESRIQNKVEVLAA
jgi:hypothetical protein